MRESSNPDDRGTCEPTARDYTRAPLLTAGPVQCASDSVIGKMCIRSGASPGGTIWRPASLVEPERSEGPNPGEQSASGFDDRLSVRELVPMLANGLRYHMGRAQETCRLRRRAPDVTLSEHGGADGVGHLVIEGVTSCKSCLCPLCVQKWQRVRAGEIGQAMCNRGHDKALFVTETIRHHRGQSIALQQRLMSKAHSGMWSGRAGLEFSELLGGKPEYVRAFDRTGSFEHGWHIHLHNVYWMNELRFSIEEYEELFYNRWCESLHSTLGRFQSLCTAILTGEKRCNQEDCGACKSRTECTRVRESAKWLLGARMILKGVPLVENARRIARQLRAFYVYDQNGCLVPAITPSREHGVKVERCGKDGLQTYLTKLGCLSLELACSWNKLGRLGDDGLKHYSQWQIARIACEDGHPDQAKALELWSELFFATRGLQTILFSDREALGLKPDPLAYEEEPDEPQLADGEWHRKVASIAGSAWDDRVREAGHGWLTALLSAYADGRLFDLDCVERETGWHSVPAYEGYETGPPARREQWCEIIGAEVRAEQRGGEFFAPLNRAAARKKQAQAEIRQKRRVRDAERALWWERQREAREHA